MATHNLQFGTLRGKRWFTAYIGDWDIHAHMHIAEYGLALTYWTPMGLSLTVGPFTLKVGNSSGTGHFFGPGVSYYPRDNYGAVFISDKLWYEFPAAHYE